MKILVTGGAGFVGTNLLRTLSLNNKYKLYSVDNYSTGLKSNEISGVQYHNCDIRPFNVHNFKLLLNQIKPDIIFHLAAIARIQPSFDNPINYFNTNANGTLILADWCSKNNIPIIYAGSSSHHSGKLKNPYTFSKDIGEEILQLFALNFNLKYSIARFYNVYGPNQLTEGGYTTLIGRWINNLQKGLPCEIYGDGEQRRDFTHVSDIVDALIKIMEQQAYNKDFELGRGKSYSVNEVASMFNITPIYKDTKPGEARDTLCESKLANEVLDWTPKINLKDYLKNYYGSMDAS
jgi:UDP-glucose 4-epimerase